MTNSKQNLKIILYPTLYWAILIIVPLMIVYNIKDYSKELNVPGIMMFYILFIAPFLYIIPYKLVNIVSTKQKLFFITLGLVIPYVILYVYIAIQVMNNFNNSRFPF